MSDSRMSHEDAQRRLAFFDRVEKIDRQLGATVDFDEIDKQWELLSSGVFDGRIRDTCLAVFFDL